MGEGKRDHLVSWDQVCKPKGEEGLRARRMALRNKVLLRKRLWRLWKVVINGTRSSRIFMGNTLMDGMTVLWLGCHINALRRPWHRYFGISLGIEWVMVQKFDFGKIFDGVIYLFIFYFWIRNSNFIVMKHQV